MWLIVNLLTIRELRRSRRAAAADILYAPPPPIVGHRAPPPTFGRHVADAGSAATFFWRNSECLSVVRGDTQIPRNECGE